MLVYDFALLLLLLCLLGLGVVVLARLKGVGWCDGSFRST
jgi:hypothetical protein